MTGEPRRAIPAHADAAGAAPAEAPGRNIDLCVVAERGVFDSDAAWLAALSQIASLGVPGLILQIRAKEEPPERFETLAREAREVTRGASVPVLLNGDTATAIRLGYAGVHWPEAVIPDAAETAVGLRGASVHSPEACARAEAAGAHFAIAGTVFDAGSKPVAGTGIEALRAITGSTRLSVLAIGGITPQRVAACIEAGAAGVAVVTNVLHAADRPAAVQALHEALTAARALERTGR